MSLNTAGQNKCLFCRNPYRHSNIVVVPVQVKIDHRRKRQKEECCKLLSSHYFSTIREADQAPRAKRSSSLYCCLFPCIREGEREREKARERERERERDRKRERERERERETEKEKRMRGSLGKVPDKGMKVRDCRAQIRTHRSQDPYLELHTLVRVNTGRM